VNFIIHLFSFLINFEFQKFKKLKTYPLVVYMSKKTTHLSTKALAYVLGLPNVLFCVLAVSILFAFMQHKSFIILSTVFVFYNYSLS